MPSCTSLLLHAVGDFGLSSFPPLPHPKAVTSFAVARQRTAPGVMCRMAFVAEGSQVFLVSLRPIPGLNSGVWPVSKAHGEGPEMWLLQS